MNKLTERDYFAAHAPIPNAEQIRQEEYRDKGRNPYNTHDKPPIRSINQIIACLAYEYADAMMWARERKV